MSRDYVFFESVENKIVSFSCHSELCIVMVHSRNDGLCVKCARIMMVFPGFTGHDRFHRRLFSISVMQHWRGEILAIVAGLWRQTERGLSAVSVWKSWNQIRDGGPDTGVIWNQHYPQCTASLKCAKPTQFEAAWDLINSAAFFFVCCRNQFSLISSCPDVICNCICGH